jgi:hypothetical protein
MVKVGTEKDYSNTSISAEHLKNHYPEKVEYSLDRILADLLDFAARQLALGGRVVYWLPVIRHQYKVERGLGVFTGNSIRGWFGG